MPRPSYVVGVGLAAGPGDQLRGHDGGLALGEHPGLGGADAGDVADGVHVLERGAQRQRVDRDPAVLGQPGVEHDLRARGARVRRGTGRTAARCRRASVATLRAGSRPRTSAPGCHAIPRSRELARAAPPTPPATAGSARRAASPARPLERSSRPRAARWSCTSSAVSLGAGGHLNGVEVTATTTWPPSKASSTSRSRERARHRVELVAGLDQPRGVPRGAGRRRAPRRARRRPADRRRSRRCRATGSIDAHRGVHEPHAGRRQVGVPVQHVLGARPGRTSRRAWRSRRRSLRPGRPGSPRRRSRVPRRGSWRARVRRSRRPGSVRARAEPSGAPTARSSPGARGAPRTAVTARAPA